MNTITLTVMVFGALALPLVLVPEFWTQRSPVREMKWTASLLWIINRWYCLFWHRLEVVNPCPLPSQGAAVLVSNHTCGIDHMLLQACTDRLLGFMIAKEFFDLFWAKPFCELAGCIPVKRDGRDVGAARIALKALKDGRVLPIFPEGKINPLSGDSILEFKAGASFIALRGGVTIVPAYIRGTPRTNEIGVASRTPSRAQIRFGEPIDPRSLGDPSDHEAGASKLRDAVESLRLQALAEDPDRF